jgi:ketosteroid isomerase-like protein
VLQENLETIRRFYECVNRGDWDCAAELADPDIEQPGTIGGLEERRLAHGLSEIREVYERDEEAWRDYRIEPERLFDAGDRVVVFHREYQRGQSSGMELVTETAAVIDLKDGRIARIQGYMERAAALQAAGLSAEDL